MQDGTTSAESTAMLAITGGMAPVPGLLGDAKIGLSAALKGQDDITLSRLQLDARTLTLPRAAAWPGVPQNSTGSWHWPIWRWWRRPCRGGPTRRGMSRAPPTISLPLPRSAATSRAGGMPRGPVKFSVQASGLPAAPAGHITGEGRLAGAPLSLAVAATRAGDGALAVSIERADWNSAHAEGALTLAAGATLPRGKIAFRMTRLDDLRPLIGRELAGRRAGRHRPEPARHRRHQARRPRCRAAGHRHDRRTDPERRGARPDRPPRGRRHPGG